MPDKSNSYLYVVIDLYSQTSDNDPIEIFTLKQSARERSDELNFKWFMEKVKAPFESVLYYLPKHKLDRVGVILRDLKIDYLILTDQFKSAENKMTRHSKYLPQIKIIDESKVKKEDILAFLAELELLVYTVKAVKFMY